MDHDGQIEKEGRVMSQSHVDEDDNLSNSEALSAQTQNLNETNTPTEKQTLPLLQNEGRCVIKSTSLNNNGNVEEGLEKGKEGCRDEDEEEDIDEVMKEEEEEEEEESEGSSCLIRCQSPDTPMTDSSYSETGSLLETPYPLSPGTSPEPTSPVIPEVHPETVHPISSLEQSQSDAEVNSYILNTGSGASTTASVTCTRGSAFTTGPVDVTAQTMTSGTWPSSPTGSTEASGGKAEQLTSPSEPGIKCGPIFTSSSASSAPLMSGADTFVLNTLTRFNTSTSSTPANAATEPLCFTARPNTTHTELTSTTSAVASNQGPISSTPVAACVSDSACSTEPVSTPALLESLQQLVQRGDDTHLPQYLHQIAEAFVLCEDYQRALWFVQLERLYHQRVLDNLNALQEQWESQCGRTSSDLATPHLDTLKHICQTHTRPRTSDAEHQSLDLLISKFKEGDSQPSCASAHQVEAGMEQKAEENHCPARPSVNLPERLNTPEIFETNRENPNTLLEGRDIFCGSQLTDKQDDGRERGEAEGGVGRTISVIENGLHPPTAVGMDQSKPAEQQREDSGPAPEKEEKGEEEVNDVEEATEALEMEEEEAEDEGEEKPEGAESCFSQKALPVETLVSGAEVEVQHINQEAAAEELHETQHHHKTQESSKPCLHKEAHPPLETHMQPHVQYTEEKEEEWDYEVDQADLIREAASLDDMAKLITVEEISPASGLVSILKKRSVYMDSYASARSVPRPEKATPKRRVRFQVPDDNYDYEIGGGDSCLLLFFLCLVTVVISVGGTALYCAFGDTQSSVCQDFSRNADFYIGQIHRGISQIQHWLAPGS